MKIYDPLGVILSANNIQLDMDNSFTKIISLDSPFYDLPGTYLINVEYGKLKSNATFDMVGKTEIIDIPHGFLEPAVLAMVTDKDVYHDDEYVIVAGIVTAIDEPSVLIGIYDNLGSTTGFYFADIDENYEFSTSFLAKGGVNFKTDGAYSAIAHYGDSEYKINFEFAKQDKSLKENSKKPDTVLKELAPKTVLTPEKTETTEAIPIHISSTKEEHIQQIEKQIENEDENDSLSVEDAELGKMLNEIQLNCDTEKYSDSVLYYDGMGPALLRLCKYDEAILFIDKSLQNDPNNTEILTNKGIALNKLGHHKEALTYFDHVLSIDPRFVPAINNKANILATLGNFHDARSLYVLAQEIDPEHHSSKINLSKIQQNLYYGESEPQIIYVTNIHEESLSQPVPKTDHSVANSNENIKKINQDESPTVLKQIELAIINLKNTLLSFFS